MLRRLAWLALLLAAWVAGAGVAIAEALPECPQRNFLRGDLPPDVRIRPGGLDEPLQVELRAVIPLSWSGSAEMADASPQRLCYAIYGDLMVNDIRLCGAFGNRFEPDDRIASRRDRLGFVIKGTLFGATEAGTSQLAVTAVPQREECAAAPTVTVAAPPAGKLAGASSLPRRASNEEVTWSTRDWRPGQESWRLSYYGSAGNARLAPRSWSQAYSGWPLYLARTMLNPAIAILAVFLGFALFAKRLAAPIAVQGAIASTYPMLAAACALLVAAQFADFMRDLGGLLRNTSFGGALNATLARPQFHSTFEDPLIPAVAAGAAIVVPFLLLLGLPMVFAGRRRRRFIARRDAEGPAGAQVVFAETGTPDPVEVRKARREEMRFADLATTRNVAMAVGAAYVRGGSIALSGAAVTLGFALLPLRDLPFELPAIAISAALAYWFWRKTGHFFGIAKATAAGIALLLALTLLYPHDPVVTSSDFQPPAASNAFYWLKFLCEYLADVALLLTLLVIAFRIATGRKPEDPHALIEMLFLFGISIALFGLGNLIDAAIFFALMYLVRHALVRPKAAGRPLSQPAASRVAFLAGLIAVAAVLVQFATRGTPGPSQNRFLLEVYVLFRAAVPAAIGALILSRFASCLPGRTAVFKAILLAAVALGAKLAAGAQYAVEHRSILPAVADVVGLATALLVVALIRFDLPETKVKLRGATWKEKLSKSGLSWLVTSLAGLAAAIASAVSPIVFDELGKRVGKDSVDRLSPATKDQSQPAQAGPAPSQ